MEILTAIISFILLAGLIGFPFLILYRLNKRNIKYKFIAYLTLGVIISATITLTFAWWADTSDQILLSHYGYDFTADNDTERFANVTEGNMERVKSLEYHMMGVGWPLKAIMVFVFYSPYLLIVYLVIYLIGKRRQKNYT